MYVVCVTSVLRGLEGIETRPEALIFTYMYVVKSVFSSACQAIADMNRINQSIKGILWCWRVWGNSQANISIVAPEVREGSAERPSSSALLGFLLVLLMYKTHVIAYLCESNG